MGEAEQGRVGDTVELLANRLIDSGMPVTVDVAPERRDTVEIPPALAVDQLASVGGLDHERLLRDPIALLREGVPKMIVIEPSSVLHSPEANI